MNMRTFATNQNDIPAVNRNCLVDIQNIYINKNLPPTQRIQEYIQQVGDPYHFSVGDTVVTIRFNGDKSLTDRLTDALRTMGKSTA